MKEVRKTNSDIKVVRSDHFVEVMKTVKNVTRISFYIHTFYLHTFRGSEIDLHHSFANKKYFQKIIFWNYT